METAFRLADDVLRQSVQGITELITETGMINVDFAHISRLIRLGGGALMAIGQGHGEGKARMAIDQALNHPLLESVPLDHAAGVIANFTGGPDLTLLEVNDALLHLQAQTGPQTEIVMGVMNDDRMNDRTQVILVVTGLGGTTLEEAMANVRRPIPVERPSTSDRAAAASVPARTTGPAASLPHYELRSAAVEPPVRTVTPPAPPAAMRSEPLNRVRVSPSVAQPQAEYSGSQNLDIPAFMRRRARLAG
jgi:cell division protein FtsZ